MDALTLLRDQAAMAERLAGQILAELTDAQARWRLEGSTANPIAPTILHVYENEDRVVQGAQDRAPLWDGAWPERAGAAPRAVWAGADPDLARVLAYAAAVRAATARFLAALEPAALEREVDTPRGKRPLAAPLSLVLVVHKFVHLGEVAALLGCQGAKGFPV